MLLVYIKFQMYWMCLIHLWSSSMMVMLTSWWRYSAVSPHALCLLILPGLDGVPVIKLLI